MLNKGSGHHYLIKKQRRRTRKCLQESSLEAEMVNSNYINDRKHQVLHASEIVCHVIRDSKVLTLNL